MKKENKTCRICDFWDRVDRNRGIRKEIDAVTNDYEWCDDYEDFHKDEGKGDKQKENK